MRYQVRYVEKVSTWAVIDTRVGNKVVSLHDNKNNAAVAAWSEEERWYKYTPPGNDQAALGAS